MPKKIKFFLFVLVIFLTLGALPFVVSAAELSGSDLKLVDFSSEQNNPNGDKWLAEYAIDGDILTVWSNPWDPTYKGPPHHLTLDLGKLYGVTGFTYAKRTDYDGADDGDISTYIVYVSKDGTNFVKAHEGKLDTVTPNIQTVTFAGANGQYFKIVQEDQEWINVAELTVLVGDPVAESSGSTTLIIIIVAAAVVILLVLILFRKKLFAAKK
jgi:hypothetical protein